METGNQVPEINQMPLISIVVPAYNIEQYLPRCLDSILGQSYQNIEIVLVDDGSKDKTGRIADSYAEQYTGKIKVIHLENGGVTRARLTGIRETSGEWIGFVDGDDFIEPDMYQRLMNNAIRYHADISHCGYQTIVNDGERIHYFYNTGRLVRQDKQTGLKDLLEGSFVEPGLCNKIFHKTLFHSLLHNVDLLEGLRINEDLLMNYFLFKEANSAVYEDFCPYHYMTRTTSATRSQFSVYKVLDPVRVRKTILDDVVEEHRSVAESQYLKACMGAYASLRKNPEYETESKEYRKTLVDNWDKCAKWRRNDQIKLKLLLLCPDAYDMLVWFYDRYIQRKVYE